MIYGYARCSTNESKQDINRQVRELKAAGAEKIFLEYEHGDAVHKKEQMLLFDTVKEGDTIIVLEVPRLARSTKQLCDIIQQHQKEDAYIQSGQNARCKACWHPQRGRRSLCRNQPIYTHQAALLYDARQGVLCDQFHLYRWQPQFVFGLWHRSMPCLWFLHGRRDDKCLPLQTRNHSFGL